jgi:hypothetical protein
MYACACVQYAVLFPPADQGLSFVSVCQRSRKPSTERKLAFWLCRGAADFRGADSKSTVVQNSFVPFDDAKLISLFKPYNSSTVDSESVRKIQKKFGTFFGKTAIFHPSSGYKSASQCYFFV